jgi:hypothetical protein
LRYSLFGGEFAVLWEKFSNFSKLVADKNEFPKIIFITIIKYSSIFPNFSSSIYFSYKTLNSIHTIADFSQSYFYNVLFALFLAIVWENKFLSNILRQFLIRYYCLFLTFWQSGLSSNSETRGDPIYLKFLPSNLALIYILFQQLKKIPTAGGFSGAV